MSSRSELSSRAKRGICCSVFLMLPSVSFAQQPLRVCADPNNLPFSNEKLQGFENRLASLVARELGRTVQYTWWAQRRGFVRSTLKEKQCDVIMGVPAHMDMVLTTEPYYRSTYVFVARRDRGLTIGSFDDPALRNLKIGVQLIGDDYANTPPAHALANRGLVSRIVGFPVYGDYTQPNPPARIVDAVARGDVDVAVVWGPLAGYFATREKAPLTLTPVSPAKEGVLPFTFAMAMGVRKGDTTFKRQLDAVIARRRASIDSLLDAFGVPRVASPVAIR